MHVTKPTPTTSMRTDFVLKRNSCCFLEPKESDREPQKLQDAIKEWRAATCLWQWRGHCFFGERLEQTVLSKAAAWVELEAKDTLEKEAR